MRTSHMVRMLFAILTLFGLLAKASPAQSTNAALGGQITDQQGRAVPGVSIILTNLNTGITYDAKTNEDGIYNAPNLPPGIYRANVTKDGFKSVVKSDVELHVQDVASINFQLQVGSVSETVTVEAGALVIDTTDATVSTVVDRQFAENLPLNGRSFQTLIELTPGVVLTSSNSLDSGQFSVNGQRAVSNYWMVDGVSANIGVGVNAGQLPGNGLGGTLGAFSAQGGTNSLVSVDAMQEFRVQTSTYAPEFGRTPGAQISIVTRSGTNEFHGTVFDYFRNSVLDANDWFANQQGLPKPQERQNDFGGTLSGPLLKDRTFFFFSYEGQRLRLPQVALTTVPDASFTPGGTTDSRDNAILALQPFLKAFPLPNASSSEIFMPCDPSTDPSCPPSGQEATGSAAFNASYSNSSTLNAYSLRIDHKLSGKVSLFARYNYSPSELVQRGENLSSLSGVFPIRITTQTATVGASWFLNSSTSDDLRFNYSRTNASGSGILDTFGGAVPLASLPFPESFTAKNASLNVFIDSLQQGSLVVGQGSGTLERQINVVDSLSMQERSHSLKIGIDFRRLSPQFKPSAYLQDAIFADVPSTESGILSESLVTASARPTFLFRNLGIYGQDVWHVFPRLTVTYGLRWDIDFVPQSLNGPNFPAVTGFDLTNLSNLALAPVGTPPYKTKYGNFAPRLGIAYQLRQAQDWETVLRGGIGIFYDLASSEAGNSISTESYPFGSVAFGFGGTFPLSSALPPPIVPPNASNPGGLFAFDPKLKLPYTLEWNVALEQALGQKQTVSASYIGAAGRRLIQTAFVLSPNAALTQAQLVTNAAASDYSAAQFQFQRRLAHGLQVLASYTWSHSIDSASAGSAFGNLSNILSTGIENENRGPSDFDIRHSFSAGVTYDIPSLKANSFARAILGGWSSENFIVARSAPPLTVFDEQFQVFNGAFAAIRPDLVPGQPLYLYGTQCASALEPLDPSGQHFGCPGDRGLNPAAFTDPPVDASGNPTRQGTLGRNALRAFGAAQWDFAIHRDFPIHESLKLQFRAEMFNVLNHPNFEAPNGFFFPGLPGFGVASQMLGQSLNNSNLGGGGMSALYQIGGPRSIQLALKLSF